RVLNHLPRVAGDVDLLAVGPRVFPQRPQRLKGSAHGPLGDVLDGLDSGGVDRLSGPGRGRALNHLVRNEQLLLARVGIDDVFALSGSEAIDRPSIERIEPYLGGGL